MACRRIRRRAVSGQKRAGRKLRADLGRLVREDGGERRDGKAAQAVPADRRQPARATSHGGGPPRARSRGRSSRRRRPRPRAAARARTRRESSADEARSSTSTASRKALGAAEREREHHRCVAAAAASRRSIDGPLQVLLPVGSPALASAIPSSSSSARLVGRRRWLLERAAQEHRLRLGRSLPCRRTRGLDQALDDPVVAGGLARRAGARRRAPTRPAARRAAVRRGGGPARAPRWRAPSRSRCGRSDG